MKCVSAGRKFARRFANADITDVGASIVDGAGFRREAGRPNDF